MTKQLNYLTNYIGGKSGLRKTLAQYIPEDIGSYIEVFGGGAWLLFYREKWANLEVYNDLDKNLYNLFNVIKFHPEAFIKEFRFMLNSRDIFNDMKDFAPVTDIQKAAKFFYLLQRSYGAKKGVFATARNGESSGGKSQCGIIERVAKCALRLDKVYIENLDFEELIRRYDIENAFFYLDPPYTKGAGYDIVSTKKFEHERLKNTLLEIKGRFMLSYDDSPEIRKMYKDFNIRGAERKNNLSAKNAKYKEVIITNY